MPNRGPRFPCRRAASRLLPAACGYRRWSCFAVTRCLSLVAQDSSYSACPLVPSARTRCATRPVDLYSSAAPLPRLRSISVVPKPRRRGAITGGPPLSAQSRVSLVGRYSSSGSMIFQLIPTWPPSLLRAPYLTAFVVSSWSTSARLTVVRNGRTTGGPDRVTFVPSASR